MAASFFRVSITTGAAPKARKAMILKVGMKPKWSISVPTTGYTMTLTKKLRVM